MSYKLFTFTNGNIVINKIEILTIPSFKTILRRDKGSPGDSTGLKKLQAFKEFAYIYHICDAKSVPNRNGYSNKDANRYAVEKSGLPLDYVPDKIVKDAIQDYKDEQTNIATETIRELLKIYKLKPYVYNKVRISIQELLKGDTLNYDQAREAFGLLDSLIEQGSKLLDVTAKLTKSIKELELIDEQEQREKLRGSEDFVPDSAIPDKDY